MTDRSSRPRTAGAYGRAASSRTFALTVAGLAVAGLAVAAALVSCGASPRLVAPTVSTRDFMFQIDGYRTRDRGGQTVDLYFYYRYGADLPESRLPNYLDLRDDAYHYLDTVDLSKPRWETLNAALCHRLKDKYPIDAISCELQVRGDLDGAARYEPGSHSSVETIGDVPPLQIPGPRDDDARPTPS